MFQAWLAEFSISCSTALMACGSPWPPTAGSQASAGQPAATKAWYASR
jgi:hypothetical protein